MTEYKIGLVSDNDFGSQHIPPYPKPSFISFENPDRIKVVLNCLKAWNFFKDDKIQQLSPIAVDESIIELAHSKYHIESVKNISKLGGGILTEEVFISEDTFQLAKKAVGGAIQALEAIIDDKVNCSFALIRPPGHHALRENASGLCIFNNIANAILYLRNRRKYKEKIAIIDIDNHFGDGLAQYFYEDPSVLYYSFHEYDFGEPDLGMINELGSEKGLGTNINIPIPSESTDEDFFECFDLMESIIRQYKPGLIVIATGFDMYFADPIGNCLFTSKGYYEFAKRILKISNEVSHGKLSFILEGGYSIIGLPYCVKAVLNALLDEEFKPPEFESLRSTFKSQHIGEIQKINSLVKRLLTPYWDL
jgi:acetoin utilization deacetylase AcuC-like enzyme